MYRPSVSSYENKKEPQVQVQVLPRHKETDTHLREYQRFEHKLTDLRKGYSVIEKSANKRIACFATSSRTYGRQPEFYRDSGSASKRNSEGGNITGSGWDDDEETTAAPEELYKERKEARKQLPVYKEAVEKTEMLQAQYLFDLKRQCMQHHYAVFRYDEMSIDKSKLTPDMADAQCLHCFDVISAEEGDRFMSGSNPIVYLYPSSVDFQSKLWNSATTDFSGTGNTLQPLF